MPLDKLPPTEDAAEEAAGAKRIETRDPTAAWARFKAGSGSWHALTNRIAKTVFEQHWRGNWERACEHDQWLAVSSWQIAEAVVAELWPKHGYGA